ncbi:MAG: hypothetical protein M3422_16150 [Actinomycetota bacterium]|nr:hypothetical protein [Actinomycetota bacterium]
MTRPSPYLPAELPRVDTLDNSQVLSYRIFQGAEQLVEQYDNAVGHEKAAVRARMQQFRSVTLANLSAGIKVPVSSTKIDRVHRAIEVADRIVAEALTRP